MRDIILFVQKSFPSTVESIKQYGKDNGTPFRVAVLYDESKKKII